MKLKTLFALGVSTLLLASCKTASKEHVHSYDHELAQKEGWLWKQGSGDNYSATLTFTCPNCTEEKEGHKKVVDATVKKEYSGDCQHEGTITYTASATFEEKTYTATKTVATEHGAHNMTKHEGVAQTCTVDGVRDYYTCSVEGDNKYYKDAEGSEKFGATTQEELEIEIREGLKATGHNLNDSGVCQNEGCDFELTKYFDINQTSFDEIFINEFKFVKRSSAEETGTGITVDKENKTFTINSYNDFTYLPYFKYTNYEMEFNIKSSGTEDRFTLVLGGTESNLKNDSGSYKGFLGGGGVTDSTKTPPTVGDTTGTLTTVVIVPNHDSAPIRTFRDGKEYHPTATKSSTTLLDGVKVKVSVVENKIKIYFNDALSCTLPYEEGSTDANKNGKNLADTLIGFANGSGGMQHYTFSSFRISAPHAHDYSHSDPTWTWNSVSGGYNATAKFECNSCSADEEGHYKTVNANVTHTSTEGDCQHEVETTYTATAELDGRSFTATKSVTTKGAHNLTKHPGTPATCVSAGTKDYWTCSVEGDNGIYKDANGSATFASMDDINIAALGHDISDVDGHCKRTGCDYVLPQYFALNSTSFSTLEAKSLKFVKRSAASVETGLTIDEDNKKFTFNSSNDAFYLPYHNYTNFNLEFTMKSADDKFTVVLGGTESTLRDGNGAFKGFGAGGYSNIGNGITTLLLAPGHASAPVRLFKTGCNESGFYPTMKNSQTATFVTGITTNITVINNRIRVYYNGVLSCDLPYVADSTDVNTNAVDISNKLIAFANGNGGLKSYEFTSFKIEELKENNFSYDFDDGLSLPPQMQLFNRGGTATVSNSDNALKFHVNNDNLATISDYESATIEFDYKETSQGRVEVVFGNTSPSTKGYGACGNITAGGSVHAVMIGASGSGNFVRIDKATTGVDDNGGDTSFDNSYNATTGFVHVKITFQKVMGDDSYYIYKFSVTVGSVLVVDDSKYELPAQAPSYNICFTRGSAETDIYIDNLSIKPTVD